jgi:beta-glucanase (GH16 family)
MRLFLLSMTAVLLALPSAGQVKPVWADEFDKDGLPDPAKWTYDTGGHGWGNRELQYYLADRLENAQVKGGMLHITARREDLEGKPYTSSRMVSKAEWKYGYIEIRAKLPKGLGTWPALWMLPTSRWEKTGPRWPLCGEIDIMEHVGYDEGVIHGTVHTGAYNHVKGTQKGKQVTVPDATGEFHLYALDWRPDHIEILVDGKSYFSFADEGAGQEVWPLSVPFKLLMNIAVGGNWGGRQGVDEKVFPQEMVIDYVRVYEKKP